MSSISANKVAAYRAVTPKGKLEKFEFELPEIGNDEVDVKVAYCGICHSDLNMIDDDWGRTHYPIVPGHEVVGQVSRIGKNVAGVEVGDYVGVGWISRSCMRCEYCLSGHQHFCTNAEETIVGRYGGFADTIRVHSSWTIPLPAEIDLAKAGPLLCAGITVFAPIMKMVKPTDRVGVIGIGGLGHLAVKFLKHWGCEVVAFSSNRSKEEEIRSFGATRVVNSADEGKLNAFKGSLNFILSTVNVPLNWDAYLNCLKPMGELHSVGVVLEPMSIPAFSLINGDKKVGGSPSAGPAEIRLMLDFCVRHNIYPVVEEFKMEDVNAAIEHVKQGRARYRVVLKAS